MEGSSAQPRQSTSPGAKEEHMENAHRGHWFVLTRGYNWTGLQEIG